MKLGSILNLEIGQPMHWFNIGGMTENEGSYCLRSSGLAEKGLQLSDQQEVACHTSHRHLANTINLFF